MSDTTVMQVVMMTPSSFHIADIPAEGLNLDRTLTGEDLGLTVEEARVQDGLSLSVEASKSGEQVHVSGLLAGIFLRQCVRCLKDYRDVVRLPFSAEFRREDDPRAPRSKPAKAESRTDVPEAELESDEDIYPYAGEAVDLAEMLREQVILATPMQPLCHAACRGLCPVCGRDRNVTACGCVEQTGRSPFAILQDLKKDMKKP